MERTFAIIKPDAVSRHFAGDIIKRIEDAGLRICAMRLLHLSRMQAQAFYAVHRERPFFNSLCEYMTSGPVVVMALEGERAISRWRELMGATDPGKAAVGTIRKDLGVDIEKNAVHGSDAAETAIQEVGFFFSGLDFV